jgi:hypothetical protein
VIASWAERERLRIISIDSAIKLVPPACDTSAPEHASEVFNQLQRLPTLWLIAHDRKGQSTLLPGISERISGNDEIVGSGRFAQDPDVVHHMVREDARAPHVLFRWGKVREGEKCQPLDLWFDRVDFRLHPIHPLVHLLRDGPKLETCLIAEAAARYGWKERRAREFIATMLKLRDASGVPVVSYAQDGHNKRLTLDAEAIPPDGEEDVEGKT